MKSCSARACRSRNSNSRDRHIPGRAYRLLAWLATVFATHLGLYGAESPAELPALNSVQQVLDLGLENARRCLLPVRLQGLVTYPDPAMNLLYLQDASAGIRVLYTNVDAPLVSGQRVVVEGTVAGGMFAPFIDCANVRVTGTAAIPEPCQAPAARMIAGELFGQWVQVEGVVRDVAVESGRALLFVASGGLRFHAVIQPYRADSLPLTWIDSRIVLRGVCWTEVDAENKPIGFTLYVPGTNHVFVSNAGERDVFNAPALTVRSQPELRRQSDVRLKVAGTVTFHSPGGYVYLNDARSGEAVRARLLVPLARANPHTHYVDRPPLVRLRPGDGIELVGAPTAALLAPTLQDAEFRRATYGPPPAALSINAGDLASGKFDGQLVTLKGRLLGSETRQAGGLKQQIMALQSGDTWFEALWEYTGTNNLPLLPKNAYVQAAGICVAQLGELNQVRSCRILLRESSDLQLLGRPPWWEPWPVGRILAIALALGMGALAWIWILRRQVAQSTALLRAEVVERQRAQAGLREALESERELSELRSRFVSMVSHEFRTPLGVILSATENLQHYFDRLEPEPRQRQLQHVVTATRQMAKVMENVLLLSRVDAAKMEFKPAMLDLAAFCQKLVAQVQTSMQADNQVEFHSHPLPPALADEALLRHILINLLSNALKYSLPGGQVQFTLEQDHRDAIFRVQDHGLGISTSDQKRIFSAFHRGRNASHLPGTGLGLVIVKRCVELHRGEISFESAEGKGTTFQVRLPVFGSESNELHAEDKAHAYPA